MALDKEAGKEDGAGVDKLEFVVGMMMRAPRTPAAATAAAATTTTALIAGRRAVCADAGAAYGEAVRVTSRPR